MLMAAKTMWTWGYANISCDLNFLGGLVIWKNQV
jgi:hypothetical protein